MRVYKGRKAVEIRVAGAAVLTMPSPSYPHGKKPSGSLVGTEDGVWGPQLEISLGRVPT